MGTLSLTRTGRIRRRVAAASLSMLALAGVICGAATTAHASDLAVAAPAGPGCPAGVAGGTSVTAAAHWAAGMPWRSVGRGWILADLAKSQALGAPGTLYLVAPGGRRYRLGPAPANGILEDWSGNGTNALFFADKQESTTASVIVINLRTGRASRFTVYSATPFPGLSFTRPDGKAILFQAGTTSNGTSLPLQRLSLTGARELCYPTQFARAGGFIGGYQENANGTELVLSTQNGLEVVSNAGQPFRALAVQGQDFCDLLNWWNSQSVLADCAGQLRAYPLSGGRPEQLTSSRDAGAFLGAWRLPSGTYAEAAACGSTWLEKLNQNGTATTLSIPGAADAGTVQPLGAVGGQLPLLIGGGCDGHFAFSFVDWYNPAANVARTVIGGPAGGGYVTDAVLFPAG
jgi:hypothetical protein